MLSTKEARTLPVTVGFSYDLNGNLLSDGLKGYEYDDANQLVRVTVTNGWKAEFAYDGLGRRRITKDYSWSGSAWSLTNEVRYVWDGMVVLQERDGANAVKVTYTRGLDLSGTRQGAGGIGGLLARTDANGSTFYHSDAGGNITAMTDGNGNVVARYLYDPFGNLLAKSGVMADANHYRFSSKEVHPNSGLYYYGFRYYEPNLQRWLNEDPIGEAGGMNLYGFVGNSPLGLLDLWGFDYLSALEAACNARTCMDCHGNREVLDAGILPQDTPWFNSHGTEMMQKWALNRGIITVIDWRTGLYLALEDALHPASLNDALNQDSHVSPTDANSGGVAGTIQENRAKGKDWENEHLRDLEKMDDSVRKQITLRSCGPSGRKTVMDFVSTDRDTQKPKLTEAKSSQTAPLTDAQKVTHPEIEKYGAVVAGEGKPPYSGGTRIPPTNVDVARPPVPRPR